MWAACNKSSLHHGFNGSVLFPENSKLVAAREVDLATPIAVRAILRNRDAEEGGKRVSHREAGLLQLESNESEYISWICRWSHSSLYLYSTVPCLLDMLQLTNLILTS
jgi:hypothetical protein